MPSPGHEAYRNSVLSWCRNHGHEPDIAQQLEQHADAVLVLWHLDLEPARPILAQGYADKPRGGDPWDPLVPLRCLLLAILLGRPRINAWVRELKSNRLLRVLCGIGHPWRRPGVGTLYDALHRMHNGPVRRCSCGHRVSPATLERQRARAPRPRAQKPRKPKAAQGQRARRRRAKDPVCTPTAAEPSVTRRLVEQLSQAEDQASPQDLLQRLSELLLQLAVVRSARMGLLGDLGDLIVGGDGSPLRTGASRHGKRDCDCDAATRCDCPRVYRDPDAAWGYDSHRDCYFFGHHIYELTASAAGHDLPLHVRLDPGNETDFTASLRATDRLLKLLRRSLPQARVRYLLQDAGHDGEHNYRYALHHGIIPVIPLSRDAPAIHPQRPELALSSRGVPLCQAGCEMAPWGSAGDDRRLFVCPVKAASIDRCPLAPDDQPHWLCRPQAAMAPVVNLSVRQNPRLCPPVPRNTPRHKQLYTLRSGCERSFSVKKAAFNLEGARHRRKSFWLIRLNLMAVLQHARAWVADEDPMALVDHLLGRQRADRAAA